MTQTETSAARGLTDLFCNPRYPVWNTQDGCPSGAGTPDGASYVPKEVDLTLQNSDTWFYKEGMGYRSLSEMVSICKIVILSRFACFPSR